MPASSSPRTERRVPTSDWTPSVENVATPIRSRTVDNTGTEVGTFTSQTRPTDVQASQFIETAANDITMNVGTIPESAYPLAQRVTALGAAKDIELSFYPEQVASGRSPYPQLLEQYEKLLGALELAVAQAGGTPPEEPTGPQPREPVSAFPIYPFDMPSNIEGWGMLGRYTRW